MKVLIYRTGTKYGGGKLTIENNVVTHTTPAYAWALNRFWHEIRQQVENGSNFQWSEL